MGRFILVVSLTLTVTFESSVFAQWGGYGSSYGQGMARRAARYGQRMVTRHANRMIQKSRAPKQKKVKRTKQLNQDKAQQQPNNAVPEKQSTGNMSPSSDYPEWPPPSERTLPAPNQSGF